jgi:predicted nucleic acid-binding protein
MKVFIDTNLVLDVLAERKPFYETSARIWELVEKRDLTGYLSATTITDVFYILRKQLGSERAYDTVNKIMMVFDITSVSQADIKKALNLGFKDFEDALQVVCAKKTGAKYLITRNKEDFQEAQGIEVVDPEAFLLSLLQD